VTAASFLLKAHDAVILTGEITQTETTINGEASTVGGEATTTDAASTKAVSFMLLLLIALVQLFN